MNLLFQGYGLLHPIHTQDENALDIHTSLQVFQTGCKDFEKVVQESYEEGGGEGQI